MPGKRIYYRATIIVHTTLLVHLSSFTVFDLARRSLASSHMDFNMAREISESWHECTSGSNGAACLWCGKAAFLT